MKKLFNGRFLLILATSLIGLIVLTVGAFYLFDDQDDFFVKSGYVLNPLSSTVEKYFFDEKTGYKENLSSMVEFQDVDNKVVSILKESFIHYNDESISFLKKGALLDLDSLSGKNAVNFYNITDESIIHKKDKGYLVESRNGDIELHNFIGRISDNKYIVVGDLNLKMAGNATNIKGEYFEIVYVEEGIVNIENRQVKYQVTADNTLIKVGNDKVIDLGTKTIRIKDEDLMSITSITINGDENIEIIPKAPDEEDSSGGGSGSSSNGDGSSTGDSGDSSGSGDGSSSSGEGDGSSSDGGASGGTGNEGMPSEPTDDLTVSLKDAKIKSTSIEVLFDIVNNNADDVLKLQVVNLNTGRTVDIVAQVLNDTPIYVNLLTPNTKYLFMVINDKNNEKYFQKVFETVGFGIKLEKSYATDSALAYKVTVSPDTDITNAKLSLYKFNEETNQNEIVTTSYQDIETGETKTIERVTYLSNLDTSLSGEHEIIYDDLDSNSIYTVVLDEFSIVSSNFKDIYNITLTSMTLKETPDFDEMVVEKNVSTSSFSLSLSEIDDPDLAIIKYTYMIYDRATNELAVDPIMQTNASSISVKVGNGENQLRKDTNYYYKVIIEYFDNEKYIEYVTTDSITFVMGNDPFVTVIPQDEKVSYDSIGATIYLNDNACSVPTPGRCDGYENVTVVAEVREVNSIDGTLSIKPVTVEKLNFDVSSSEPKATLFVSDLNSDTAYNIEIIAIDLQSGEEKVISQTPESKRRIKTKALTSFSTSWNDKGSNQTHVINVETKFVAKEALGAMTGEESAAAIKKVIIKLYEGENIVDIQNAKTLASKTIYNTEGFNIKENFYDKGYLITNDETFGLTLDELRKKSTNGKFSQYYTIMIEAYYDVQGLKPVIFSGNIQPYEIHPDFLRDNIEKAKIKSELITNSAAGYIFDRLSNPETVVGYKMTAKIDYNGIVNDPYAPATPKNIRFYVYDSNKKKVNFYIKNEDDKLVLTSEVSSFMDESGYFETIIYMDYGTPYDSVDNVMTRGNSYYIGYVVELVSGGKTTLYPTVDANVDAPSSYGLYEKLTEQKETPSVKMYVAKSTKDSITYSYNIKDPDSAIYKESGSDDYGFYTKINNGKENKLNLVKLDADYNQFEGRLTISGLKNRDLYALYYKKNVSKTGNFSTDVLNYIDAADSGLRMFDGFYDANDSKYNFKYQIINDPAKDNRVAIKILASDSMIDRILSYNVVFNDSQNHTLNKEMWQLSNCDFEGENASKRCLYVDYTELKNANMKSNKDKNNIIKVTISALYDNGLMGYDYKVGEQSDADYRYCILQDNSSETGVGSYITYSNGGELTVWSEALLAPKGYYTYTLNQNDIYYKKQYVTSFNDKNISFNLTSLGYSSSFGYLNPKMISNDEMSCLANSDGTACNSFSFSSITPKVSVTNKASMLNGALMNLTLSGVDLSDFYNEGGNKSEYYLYVETWNYNNAGEKVSARPTLKVKIDNSNTGKSLNALIDGLYENTTYNFDVYAKMYKDGVVTYTQLFDSGFVDRYESRSYDFTTLKPTEVFHSFTSSYKANDTVYGNRDLNTKFNLVAYKNGVKFNFDLIYVLCDSGSECNPRDEDNNIFVKAIASDAITTNYEDIQDITEYDLEYGRSYKMAVYARIDLYDDDQLVKHYVRLNDPVYGKNQNVAFRNLKTPTFVVTRDAKLLNGDYIIDFNVMVEDTDKTLENLVTDSHGNEELMKGTYFVKLLDEAGNIVGDMQLLDDEGNYSSVLDYQNVIFDASIPSKKIRMTGLSENTKYTFVVYSDAYINNYSGSTEPGRENRTVEIKKTYSVYSTNNYGVAFGKRILYSATEKSFIVTFSGGSNFENVLEVSATILLDSAEAGSNAYYSKNYVLAEENKYFEIYKDSDEWVFIVDLPDGLVNVDGTVYNISMSFKIKDPATGEVIVLTSADNALFSGVVPYFKDEKKNK